MNMLGFKLDGGYQFLKQIKILLTTRYGTNLKSSILARTEKWLVKWCSTFRSNSHFIDVFYRLLVYSWQNGIS